MTHKAASPFRLVTTLAVAGAFAGLMLVLAHGATQPRILRNKAEALRRAIHEVLKDPARYETLYIKEGTLVTEDTGSERVYLGYDEQDRPVGYAIVHGEPGFQDIVKVIFGYDAATGTLLGMRVLESKETPGLGDKIEKDADFVGQFAPDDEGRPGPTTPLKGTRAGTASADDEIDMITGATISSRAVIRIINHALKRWRPLIDAHRGAAQ